MNAECLFQWNRLQKEVSGDFPLEKLECGLKTYLDENPDDGERTARATLRSIQRGPRVQGARRRGRKAQGRQAPQELPPLISMKSARMQAISERRWPRPGRGAPMQKPLQESYLYAAMISVSKKCSH